jgi:hypothetical protein
MKIDRKETPEEELNRKIRARIACLKYQHKGITQQEIDLVIKKYIQKKEIAKNAPPESEELNRNIRARIACLKYQHKGITQQEIDMKIKKYLDKKEIAKNAPPESEEKMLEREREKIKLSSARRYFINKKGGTSDEWDDRFQPKTLSKEGFFLIRKIELMKGEIGIVDSFRLCNIYMNIYPNGGNIKPQPERDFSVEKDLITMYQELKKLV